MTYREWIEEMIQKWVGREVKYLDRWHRVLDVDYNGCLLIDLPTEFTSDTAIGAHMVEDVEG